MEGQIEVKVEILMKILMVQLLNNSTPNSIISNSAIDFWSKNSTIWDLLYFVLIAHFNHFKDGTMQHPKMMVQMDEIRKSFG